MDSYQLEVHWPCGRTWFVFLESELDPDEQLPECLACGETVRDVRVIGQHHEAGRDVAP